MVKLDTEATDRLLSLFNQGTFTLAPNGGGSAGATPPVRLGEHLVDPGRRKRREGIATA